MLVQISGKYYFKDDNYGFMLCEDKGRTKFPTKTVDHYYKPLKYPSTLHSTCRCMYEIDVVPSDEFVDCCKREYEVMNWVKSINMPSVESVHALWQDVKYDKDVYVVTARGKKSYRTYVPKANMVFWDCYINELRYSEISTIEEVNELLDELVASVRKHCDDNGIECPDIKKGDYPEYLVA